MFKQLILGAAFTAAGAVAAVAAPVYTYVGSWNVFDGPFWAETDDDGNYTTGVFSGQEAAALIFGGDPDDYAISTMGDDPDDINFSAWLDGWGDWTTYGPEGGTPAPQDFSFDLNGDGLYAIPEGTGNAYSAYVSDHVTLMAGAVNYAFLVGEDMAPIPLPAGLPLLAAGLGGLALLRRRTAK